MVEAMLFLARTGCQWRYLPERDGPWTAVRVQAMTRLASQRRPGAGHMTRLAAIARLLHDRTPFPSRVMVDARTVKGVRYGPTIGTRRTILVEILGRAPSPAVLIHVWFSRAIPTRGPAVEPRG